MTADDYIPIPSDVRYTCVTCRLARGLTFAGEQQWLGPALTQPFCRRCGDPMVREVLRKGTADGND